MAIERLLIICFIVFFVLSGCSAKTDVPEEKKTIKLMFYNEESYRREFGNLLDYKFPNLHVEIVSYDQLVQTGNVTWENFNEWIDNQKPDIVTILPIPGLFEFLIGNGRLLALDHFIAKDKFDLDQLSPQVMKIVREKGQGNLYGIPPYFSSQALYYNKDLFDYFHIEVPRNGMTFEEVLELAGRFADNQIENTVVGFYKPGVSPARLLFFVGDMEGLQWLDPNERKITLNTQAWSHLFSYLIDAYKSGAVVDASLTGNGFNNGRSPTDYSQIIEQSRQRNLFVAGKAAMTIDSPLLINDINRVNPDMKWDLVTLPASKNSPAPSHLIQFQTIYAIHSESSNAELSWKLIQFMNSDEVAKMKSGTSRLDDKLPLRMKYLPDMNGKKLEAFYMLNTEDRPVSTTVIPAQFYQTFYSIVDEEIANVLNERTPISEALRIIQEKGSLELLNALSNP